MSQSSIRSRNARAITGLGATFVTCLAVIAIFIIADLLFFAQGASFLREGGGVETVSAVLYIVAAAVFLAVVPRRYWSELFHVPVLLTLFALRELDLDKAFTDAGILSLRFYSGEAAIATMALGGAVALFSLLVVLRALWTGLPAIARGVRQGALWPWFAISAAVLVAGSKTIDGLGRKLLDFGIVISKDLDAKASQVEEMAEVLIPVFAILAIHACWRQNPE